MTKQERFRLVTLVLRVKAALAYSDQQSLSVWRGDMRSIVAAHAEIARLERRIAKLSGVPLEER